MEVKVWGGTVNTGRAGGGATARTAPIIHATSAYRRRHSMKWRVVLDSHGGHSILLSSAGLGETASPLAFGCREAHGSNMKDQQLARVPSSFANAGLGSQRDSLRGSGDSGVFEPNLHWVRGHVAMLSSTEPMPGKPGREPIPCSKSPCKPFAGASRLTARYSASSISFGWRCRNN